MPVVRSRSEKVRHIEPAIGSPFDAIKNLARQCIDTRADVIVTRWLFSEPLQVTARRVKFDHAVIDKLFNLCGEYRREGTGQTMGGEQIPEVKISKRVAIDHDEVLIGIANQGERAGRAERISLYNILDADPCRGSVAKPGLKKRRKVADAHAD